MEHLFNTLNNTTKNYTGTWYVSLINGQLSRCACSSYLEIYNEKIFDLLDYDPSTKGLDIREVCFIVTTYCLFCMLCLRIGRPTVKECSCQMPRTVKWAASRMFSN